MFSNTKNIRPFLFAIAGGIALLALQSCWAYYAYTLKRRQMIINVNEALHQAYQKEQTYRIPVVDIVNPGAITIQSCGNEEILIVRKCPENDTIVYNNISGHSIERFINQVLGDLRGQIVPLNIYCLAELFAGMLYDRDIFISFTLERFDIQTGDVLETSLISDSKLPEKVFEDIIVFEISNKEAVRAILQLTPRITLASMSKTLISTFCLTAIMLLCIVFLYRRACFKNQSGVPDMVQSDEPPVNSQNNTFFIGQYCFDPAKNELTGFGETIQLNKKENSILLALCAKQGNIIERSVLLEENWGSLGLVYSRSLDTYLTKLRKYLKNDPSIQIVTVKGVGYKLLISYQNL